MAVDPKVVGGGVAVVAIGGGAGVAIQKGTAGSSQEQTIKKSGIELAIESAGFTFKAEKQGCNEALKETLSEENYKAAVVACAAEDTFKKRAEKLNLEVLNEDKITDSKNGEKAKGEKKGTKNQETIKTLKDTSESETGSGITNAESKVKEFCKKEDKITSRTKTSEGYKYLKICVKEDEETAGTEKKLETALTKDFGYNQITMGAKMKFAKFTEKTPSDRTSCTEEKLNNPYKAGEYKDLVMACSQLSDFKARAGELKLTIYPNGNGDDFGKSEGESVKDRVNSAMAITESANNNGDTVKAQVKAYCEGNDGNNKNITTKTTNQEGEKYLKVCTKDKTESGGTTVTVKDILAKDFGTGEVITSTTNQNK